jgi:hypothetical protein
MNTLTKILFGLLACLAAAVVTAVEMDHSQHGAQDMMEKMEMDHSQYMTPAHQGAMQPLQQLHAMPASGKAREGGYDGRYVMESTGHALSAMERCAQASRGLVMLDNASWTDCGGKPQGAAVSGVVQAPSRSGAHAGHHTH